MLLIATIVALGAKLVRGLMTGAIVATPSASARNLSRNLLNYKILASLLGGTSMMLGITLSIAFNTPAGSLMILTPKALSPSIFKQTKERGVYWESIICRWFKPWSSAR